MTSKGGPEGEQDPIDRKYLSVGTGDPFLAQFQAGTVYVGNRAPNLGIGSGPSAHSNDDADTTEAVQPKAADETRAFVRGEHCGAQLRDIAGRPSRRQEASAAGNR